MAEAVEQELKESLAADQSFRDSIGTIDAEGNRKFLFPKKPQGRFTQYRQYVSYFLLAIFFSVPFLEINGKPVLLLNVLERKFVILGQIFWPEDFFIFVVAMIIGVLFVAVFTVAFGRLFCGWICPQTIFLEHVFRRIEYWIDGDRNRQLRLARMPWKAEKIRKRVLKHGIFFALSFLIANFFLMYIIGKEEWWSIVSDDPSEHLGGLTSMLVFSGIFYFVFSWFREQACIIVCPYGRLQGALLDRQSVVIAYDYLRGEKRGSFRKKEDRAALGKGDCIDCNQCVDVCPTGIDIRNGTQLECINCTACIDACNSIMRKIDRPEGLIRYDSEANIASGEKRIWTGRMKAYVAILVVLLGFLIYLLGSRAEVESILVRLPGQPYQKVDAQTYSNAYNFKLLNKTNQAQAYRLELMHPKEGRLHITEQGDIEVPPSAMNEGALLIYLPQGALEGYKTDVEIGLFKESELIETIETTFVGPVNTVKRE